MDKKIINPVTSVSMRLVKNEDLNHHETLFAGRTAEWFVESGFVAVANVLDPKNLVCLKIHGMRFNTPAKSGDILKLSSKIIHAGRTSLTVYVSVSKNSSADTLVDGFITFVHVNKETKSVPHHIEIRPETDEDILLCNKFKTMIS
jgi:acyl-CoA hydrolase